VDVIEGAGFFEIGYRPETNTRSSSNRAAGVDVRVDLAGVGENLMDHAEGIVVWEVAEPPSRVCATGWDAGALLRLTPEAGISALARATHQTVYHVSGTCRMGAPDDALAVLDPDLRVRGVPGLRVVDASVFPVIPSVNPVVTVMVTAERAACLIR
jgi:choline dehydrogenase-like flavoprotein